MSSSISAPEGYIEQAFEFCWDTLGNFLRVSEVFPAALDQAMDAYKNETVFFTIRSAKANYAGACVQNAFLDPTGNGLTGMASNKSRIKRIKTESMQNLDWEWQLYNKDTFEDVDLDLDAYDGSVYLDSLGGKQLAGANQYYYDSGPIDQPYEDLDGTFELHIKLVNRSAVAKIAAAPGYIIVMVEYEPAS
jgi:hypothetical protein